MIQFTKPQIDTMVEALHRLPGDIKPAIRMSTKIKDQIRTKSSPYTIELLLPEIAYVGDAVDRLAKHAGNIHEYEAESLCIKVSEKIYALWDERVQGPGIESEDTSELGRVRTFN